MPDPRIPGGPTQDEILAVSLARLGLSPADSVLEIGCGTGTVSVAMARRAGRVFSLDRRKEAVAAAEQAAGRAGVSNIRFLCTTALDHLAGSPVYDCAFVGGTKDLALFLPELCRKVRRTIVINAVMVSTVECAIRTLSDLGLFSEAVHVQVSRSHAIAGSVMFRPLDPVYIIVARGAACS